MPTHAIDKDLRNLFAKCIHLLSELTALIMAKPPGTGEDRFVRIWAIIYTVLGADVSNSSLVLCDSNVHNRVLLILRRTVFEYWIRFWFYSTHLGDAKLHVDEFNIVATKFKEHIDDPEMTIVLDPSFDETAHPRLGHFGQFFNILKEMLPDRAEALYKRFYSYPSSLLHGDAFSSTDIMELLPDGTGKLHASSRRIYTNEIIDNHVLFVMKLAGLVSEHCASEMTQSIESLAKEHAIIRKSLGIQLSM